jgi:hypothetical protein
MDVVDLFNTNLLEILHFSEKSSFASMKSSSSGVDESTERNGDPDRLPVRHSFVLHLTKLYL